MAVGAAMDTVRTSPLRILHLEDDPKDAELIQAVLEAEGFICQVTRVDTQADFLASLEQGGFDLILADYTLPSFDGLSALALTLEHSPEVPLIFVSGTLGEEVAIEALKIGATDYVLKERLSRIVPSVRRALREAQERATRKRAEAERLRSETTFHALFEFSPDAILMVNPEGHITQANRQAQSLFGYAHEELIGLPVEMLIPEAGRRVHVELRRRFLTSPMPRMMGAGRTGLKGLKRDGTTFSIDVSLGPIQLADGIQVLAAVRDITERKLAEERIRQADSELRQIVDVVPQHIFVLEPDGRFRYANQRDLEYPGVALEDVRAPDFLARVFHPDDWRRLGPELDEAIARGAPWESEARLLGKDGQYRWFLIRLNPLRDEQGRIVRWYGTRTDIEDRKRTEEQLQQSKAYLSEAQRVSQTGSFGWTVATGQITWSEETFRIFQYDPTTRPDVELALQRVHPEDVALVQQAIERAAQNGKDLDFEHRLLMPDGSVKHVRVVGHAGSDDSSEREFVGAVMDVTAAKEAEARIRQQASELRTTIETIPTAVVSTLPDGSVEFVSQRWLDYLGWSREEMLDWGWMKITHPEDLDRVLNSWQAALAAGEPLEIEARYRQADGQYHWLLHRAVPLRDRTGKVVKWYATLTDIDDRKRAEEALRRSEAYLAEAQRLSHTGSWAVNLRNPEQSYRSVETSRIHGLEHDPSGFQSVEAVLGRIHPDDRARVDEVEQRAIIEKTDLDVAYRALLPDGSIRYLRAVGHPVISPSGDVVELVGTVMDVTERKRAERALRRARERTLQARFAAVLDERTRLARDIHDTLLQGFTGIALKLVAAVSRVTEPVESVVALRDLVRLAQETLTDARRAVWDLRSPALAAGDFPAALRTAAEDSVRGTRLELEHDVGEPPRPVDPEVEAVVLRVAQEAIANVVKHADARRVRVRLSFETRRMRLSVTDDGRGFVVPSDFQGYGGHWGLLGMRERASQIHGKLSLRSDPGRGTELSLLVPYVVRHAAPTP
jgi:PAS domain S-box-containing protein